jgi:hypothetical protein
MEYRGRTGTTQRIRETEIGAEIARFAGRSVRYSAYSYSLFFNPKDAEMLMKVVSDAAGYWTRSGKRSKALGAATTAAKIAAFVAADLSGSADLSA